jgi:hypothetical protein
MRKKPAAQGRGHQAMVTPIITPLNRGVDNEKKFVHAKARRREDVALAVGGPLSENLSLVVSAKLTLRSRATLSRVRHLRAFAPS